MIPPLLRTSDETAQISLQFKYPAETGMRVPQNSVFNVKGKG
jgi:hypothetical protein